MPTVEEVDNFVKTVVVRAKKRQTINR